MAPSSSNGTTQTLLMTRVLDPAVESFHRRWLGDDWGYLFLDGVWLKAARRRTQGLGRLNDLFGRGLCGKNRPLVISDGCVGWPALETVYPRVRHQRCWVHKMRNILEKVRRRDEREVQAEAQKIYVAKNAAATRRAFERFRFHWRSRYAPMVKQLELELPELLHFFTLPGHLWRKLRTGNVIERCFVECGGERGPWWCSPT